MPNWLDRLLLNKFGFGEPFVIPPKPPPNWYEQILGTTDFISYITSIRFYDIVFCLACISIICCTCYLLFDKILKLLKFIFFWGFFTYGVLNFIRIETVRIRLKDIIEKLIN